jgi:hypothetical protein
MSRRETTKLTRLINPLSGAVIHVAPPSRGVSLHGDGSQFRASIGSSGSIPDSAVP